MVGSDVENGADLRLECNHGFQLERADFGDGHAVGRRGKRKAGIRNFDIADKERFVVDAFHNFVCKRSCRRLSVCAGDGEHLTLIVTVSKLNFAVNGDALAYNSLHNRR